MVVTEKRPAPQFRGPFMFSRLPRVCQISSAGSGGGGPADKRLWWRRSCCDNWSSPAQLVLNQTILKAFQVHLVLQPIWNDPRKLPYQGSGSASRRGDYKNRRSRTFCFKASLLCGRRYAGRGEQGCVLLLWTAHRPNTFMDYNTLI